MSMNPVFMKAITLLFGFIAAMTVSLFSAVTLSAQPQDAASPPLYRLEAAAAAAGDSLTLSDDEYHMDGKTSVLYAVTFTTATILFTLLTMTVQGARFWLTRSWAALHPAIHENSPRV